MSASLTSHPLAVITGAGSGIGRGLALHAATQLGMHVAVLDVNPERAAETASLISGASGSASAHPVDITDAAAVTALASELIASYGPPEFLACNAGIEHTGHLWETSPEAWFKVQDINVNGAFYTAQAFLPAMIDSGSSSQLLFTSSIGGIAIPASQGAYAVSKHAIRVLAQAIAADLEDIGSPIKTSILLPSETKTAIFSDASTNSSDEAEEFRKYFEKRLAETGRTPEEVAEITFAGMAAGNRWIYTNPERAELFVTQHTNEFLEGLEEATNLLVTVDTSQSA